MKVLNDLADYLKTSLRAELGTQNHNATSQLSNSIDVVVRKVIDGFEIVGTAVYYAKFVETGRKPGGKGVPIDALIDWIRVRKIEIEGMKERSIAFMFQHSIKKKGIKPSFFIRKTLEAAASRIEADCLAAVSDLADIIIMDIFTKIGNDTVN